MSKPRKQDGVVYSRKDGKVLWMRYRDRNGKPCGESTQTEDWQEANRKLRERLQARDGNLLEAIRKGEALGFGEWVDSFLENYSKPPIRAHKSHEANMRCATHLKAAFPCRRLMDITADAIEDYLRNRLRQRVRVKVARGYREKGILKSTTVHQEFRVLRRMLNVAVRKKLLPANPCSGVEFPVAVKGLFRPHYVTWSEQEQIESHGPEYLKNSVQIITETGLRVYKELTSMKKDQVDLPNAVVWQTTFKTVWSKTLRRAKVPYFRIYDLRSTYATRLSAGGVADEWVTQMLRQGDAQVFKKYSQMKLQMKREALEKLNRRASEMAPTTGERIRTVMVQ